MFIEFLNKSLADTRQILIQSIAQGIDHFGNSKVKTGFIRVRAKLLVDTKQFVIIIRKEK